MSSPYELLTGLALLREKKRLSGDSSENNLESWSALVVKIGQDDCVVRQDDVDEIITQDKLTVVSGLVPWVLGIGYFRGQLLNVLDGKLLLNRSAQGKLNNAAARILVVRGEQEWFGLRVEELVGIRHVWSDNVSLSKTRENMDWLGYAEQTITIEEEMLPVLRIKQLMRDLEQADLAVNNVR